MSGIEKFNPSQEGLQRLKEFLLREKPLVDDSKRSSTASSLENSVMDLDESFLKIIKGRDIRSKKLDENKENELNYLENKASPNMISPIKNRNIFTTSKTFNLKDSPLPKSFSKHDDTTYFENESIWRQTTDESFEQVERMCSKTFSVENNTSFHEHDILNFGTNQKLDLCSNEINIISKPLQENTLNKKFNTLAGIADQTQLNDIEAPSCLWENTINCSELAPMVSPTKNKGMSRPSTILEESTLLSNSSSHSTDQLSGSSQYETASDSLKTNFYERKQFSKEFPSSSHNILNCEYKFPVQNKTLSSDKFDSCNETTHSTESKIRDIEKDLISFDEKNIDDTVIEISDGENDLDNSSYDLNRGFSIIDRDLTINSLNESSHDSSPNFDDTLEEINYIIKNGMKYMSEKKSEELFSSGIKAKESPPANFKTFQKPSALVSKNKKPSKCEQNFNNFKKPVSTNIGFLKPQNLRNPYEHVISPIRTYIKNTPQNPIIFNSKPSKDIYESKAIKSLDSAKKTTAEHFSTTSNLPKKAYISSAVRQVVDERKPALIPGGDKIHRYLQSTKMSAVIRHEGKIKSNKQATNSGEYKKDLENSLANLSLMSGDVSLYTLKDARNLFPK